MSVSTTLSSCPSCGAKLEQPEHADAGRCHWCGAPLAGADESVRPLVARPRLDPSRARIAVARELALGGRNWLPGTAQLVFYPFMPTGQPRKPFSALATLPPVLASGWRAAGADFLTWDGAEALGVLGETTVRVPVTLPLPDRAQVVHHPFWRVALQQDGRDTCAWCDASSGQVILPPELTVPAGQERRSRLPFVAATLALGVLAALLLPFPAALAPLAVTAAALWWQAFRA